MGKTLKSAASLEPRSGSKLYLINRQDILSAFEPNAQLLLLALEQLYTLAGRAETLFLRVFL
jgi:hypothetical protein